jgi:Rrf2 family protein
LYARGMRISAKADYAIRALVALASDAERSLPCEAIAAAQNVPYRFLKAVLRDLRRTGLVRSQRGCEGGYRVGRDPATITLAEVVAAVDGDVLTVHGASEIDESGAAAVVWRAVRARTEELLAGVTVADLLTDAPVEPAATLLRPGRVLAISTP